MVQGRDQRAQAECRGAPSSGEAMAKAKATEKPMQKWRVVSMGVEDEAGDPAAG